MACSCSRFMRVCAGRCWNAFPNQSPAVHVQASSQRNAFNLVGGCLNFVEYEVNLRTASWPGSTAIVALLDKTGSRIPFWAFAKKCPGGLFGPHFRRRRLAQCHRCQLWRLSSCALPQRHSRTPQTPHRTAPYRYVSLCTPRLRGRRTFRGPAESQQLPDAPSSCTRGLVARSRIRRVRYWCAEIFKFRRARKVVQDHKPELHSEEKRIRRPWRPFATTHSGARVRQSHHTSGSP